MAANQRSGKMAHTYKLDVEPYAEMVKRAGQAATRALKRYGEPTLSLAELRTRLEKELRGVVLSELILKAASSSPSSQSSS